MSKTVLFVAFSLSLMACKPADAPSNDGGDAMTEAAAPVVVDAAPAASAAVDAAPPPMVPDSAKVAVKKIADAGADAKK